MNKKADSTSPYDQPTEKVLEILKVDQQKGLSEGEVHVRYAQHGPNRLHEAKRRSPWVILAEQFKSMVIIVLVIAGSMALILQHWAEGMAIAAVLLINAALGFATEWKAMRSMEALQDLGGDTIRVRRDGNEVEIDSEKLVPGDIIVLEAGDLAPADIRLLESNNLRINEASLTGESLPVRKKSEAVTSGTPLAERTSMLFKGTTITEGTGEGVVVKTGMETELGRISKLTEDARKEATPLQRRLDRLGRRLAWITLATAAIIAGVGLLAGRDARLMIETAIALGVAAIPEGLPIVATIALAHGMYLMARRNALIRRLPAVETLGATGVIFTDKTGTLTQNRMTLQKVISPAGEFVFHGENIQSEEEDKWDHPLLRRIVEVGVLCNNASLPDEENKTGEEGQGDPTELALLSAGSRLEMERPDLLKEKPEVREVAFDADTMMMATYHQGDNGVEVAVKGAPRRVLEACSRMAEGEADGGRPLEDELRNQWIERSESLAAEGLRVLAVADGWVDSEKEDPYENLRFLGLVGLFDPPRETVRKAIDECQEAGIRVVMVTGDQPATAVAIADFTGITDGKTPRVMEGSELVDPDDMTDSQREKVFKTQIFARVSPEQKLHLIKLMQEKGYTVAMTGDGVNDAPALKKADIGVAMGKQGTDVARETADMVLQDDAFSSIVAAVRQGRIIFGNIRKSVMFMLCTNVAEVTAVAAASVIGGFSSLPIPLLPLQILYLNVITDVFPALALGMGKGDPDVMRRDPRPADESVLTLSHWRAVGGWALLLALCVLGSLALAIYGLGFEKRMAVTVSFLTLAFSKLWFTYNLRRSGSGFLNNDIVRNPYVAGAIVLCVILLLASVYVPGLSGLLNTEHPSPRGWLVILGMSLLPFVLGQILRMIQKGRTISP